MPRRARPSSSSDSPSSKHLARIDSAFNSAAGYNSALIDDTGNTSAPTKLSAKARGKRRAVVEDDEDDEDDEGEANMEAVQPVAGGAGGFLASGEGDGMQLDGRGGAGFPPDPAAEEGFLPVDGGGGFLPDPPAGGFLPDDGGGGGFLPEPPLPPPGGFLPDPSSTSADSPMPDASSAFSGGGGGFFTSALPGDASFAGTGGFLPSDEDVDADTSFELPTPAPLTHSDAALPPPPDAFASALGTDPSAFDLPIPPSSAAPPPPERIPLHKIPAALRQLGLHNRGLPAADLLALFEDVASDDENLPGDGKSVRRERFRKACEVLLADASSEEGDDNEKEGDGRDEDEGDYRGEEDEDDAPVVRRRRQPARTTRSTAAAAKRSTRANRVVDEDEEGEEEAEEDGGGFVREKDFGEQLDDLPSESSGDEDEYGEEEDSDGEPISTSTKKKPSASAATGRRKIRRRGSEILLTEQDLADAEDSFDLFFVDSVQEGKERAERSIGLLELQRACRVLKEKLGEGELNEMLEYAARSKGKVDLEAFARILVETGL
ncbi:hypothetical protein JCM11251_002753 [Rhodosporidiobolus azoricus]